MKIRIQLSLCVAAVLCVATFKVQAATSERVMTITLSGFDQLVNSATGDDLAVPFRATTKDFVRHITDVTGTNVDGGTLLVIDSIDDLQAPTQIVVRTPTGGQMDVTDFFPFAQGDFVRTVKFVGNDFRSATYYAIDHFQFTSVFSTPGDTNGIDLVLQGFTKETQRVVSKNVGGAQRTVTSSTLKSDGNGELLEFISTNRYVSPFKGSIKIGPPKFFP